MPSTNNTDTCPLLQPFVWRERYLTQTMYLHLVISTTINVVSWPFIVLLNALLIFFIIRRSTLRRKKSIVVIGYLAVTDLAVGVIVQPVFIATQLCRIHGPSKMCVVQKYNCKIHARSSDKKKNKHWMKKILQTENFSPLLHHFSNCPPVSSSHFAQYFQK